MKIVSDPGLFDNKEINLIDMHHHSTASDGSRSPDDIAKAFVKKGIGICMADHNQIRGSVCLAKKKELFSIPAIEVTSREAKDVLAYFYNVNDLIGFWENEIKHNIRNNGLFNLNRTTISTLDLPEKIKKYNGIPVLAHPFAMKPKDSYNFLLDKSFLKRVAGIELFSIEHTKPNQIKMIEQFEKPLVAGSDSHTISSFNALTGNHSFEVGSFLDSLLKKDNFIYYTRDGRLSKAWNKLIVVKNNLSLRAPPNK